MVRTGQLAGHVPTGAWHGAGAVEVGTGTLTPGTLLGWQQHAELDATFAVRHHRPRTFDLRRLLPKGRGVDAGAPDDKVLAELAITDDIGTHYRGCVIRQMSFGRLLAREPDAQIDLSLEIEPAPPSSATVVEIRGRNGSRCRLERGRGVPYRIEQPDAPLVTPIEREIDFRARSLIDLVLLPKDPERLLPVLRTQCANLVNRSRALRILEAGRHRTLLDDIDALCAELSQHPLVPSRVPERWRPPLLAAALDDGRRLVLTLGADVPATDGTIVGVGALVSEPRSWSVTVGAAPFWYLPSDDQNVWNPRFDAYARDDRGGLYVCGPRAIRRDREVEDLVLGFRPRLDPRARTASIVFQGPTETRILDVELPEVLRSHRNS